MSLSTLNFLHDRLCGQRFQNSLDSFEEPEQPPDARVRRLSGVIVPGPPSHRLARSVLSPHGITTPNSLSWSASSPSRLRLTLEVPFVAIMTNDHYSNEIMLNIVAELIARYRYGVADIVTDLELAHFIKITHRPCFIVQEKNLYNLISRKVMP